MSSIFDQQFTSHAAPDLQQHFGLRVVLLSKGAAATSGFLCPFSLVSDEVEIDQEALGTAAERRVWWVKISDLAAKPRQGDVLAAVSSADVETGERHEIAPIGDDPAVETHPDGVHYVVRTRRTADAS